MSLLIRKSSKAFLISILSAIYICFIAAITVDAKEQQQVLILHSYHAEYQWTGNITKGIQSALEKEKDVQLFFEYMDTKRHIDKPYLEKLLELYKHKYSGVAPDVIIVSDDNALNFLLKNREVLFPGIPIVFCGINDFTGALIAGHANITGVVEHSDVLDTLLIAMRLHPEIRQVAVVHDQTETALANVANLKKIVPELERQVEFKYLTDMTISELEEALRALPAKTIVLNSIFVRDRKGRFIPQKQVRKLINDNFTGPVYTYSGIVMSYPGTCGGKVTSGYVQGETAALIAWRILHGEPAGSIDVLRESPNVYMFNYVEMNRFGISENDLPENSIILNKPFPFYENYKEKIWLAAGAFTFLLFLIIFLFLNILQRKQVEDELIRSEKRYRTIFEDSRDAIYVVSLKGKCIDANQAMLDLFGYTREEMPNVDINNVYVNPDDRIKVRNKIEKKGFVKDFEVKLRRKDGKVMDCLLNATLRQTGVVSIPGYQGSIRDMTEQKKLETQLVQAQKMEAIGTLAAGIAHDFNNILTAVIGYAELSIFQLPEGHKAGENLMKVCKAGLRAKDLVNQILAFSRHSKQERKPIQIAPIVKEPIKLLRASLPSTIEFHQNIKAESVIVEADPTQMQQIVMNLCTNAFHAMSEKGGILEISLSEIELDFRDASQYLDLSPGKYVRLIVTDTGCGMDRELMERIFDPYFTTKEKSKGTGLGLSVVHGIVKSQGGDITVYSEPGKGSTFNVYIPVIQKESVEEKDETKPLPTGHERILFIDDELPIVDMVRQMLERLGYEVDARTSSIEALELFKSQPDRFDMVITDMTMPNMTGNRLARELIYKDPSGYTDNSLHRIQRKNNRRKGQRDGYPEIYFKTRKHVCFCKGN